MAIAKRLGTALLVAGLLSGCAAPGGNPADPLEPFNRAMYNFNDALDGAVVKPVAKGYRSVLPSFARTGVSNFFSNLEDVWISANDLLQGKFQQGSEDFLRFLINSVFGLAGLVDVAADAGFDKHNEDFGQTLGAWGLGSGPYLVLPFLGPSTVRDGLGFLVDTRADLVWRINDVPVRNSAVVLRYVSRRADLLDATDLIDQAAIDKYTFIRDAWLQRRRNLVYDGNPPRERDDSEDDPKSEEPPKSK
jgi:phospholipid-binding lipoprotein MlaA